MVLTEAHQRAEDGPGRASVALDLSTLLTFTGNWSDAVQLIGEAIAELGECDPSLALRLEAVRTATMIYDPRLIDAFDRDRERLRELARAEAWGARALAALLVAETASRGGGRDEVLALAEHARGDDLLIREPGAAGWAVSQCVAALVMVDANDRAVELTERLIAAERGTG